MSNVDIQEDLNAESNKEAAEDAAELAHNTALGDAKLAWTTSVAGAWANFRLASYTDQATAVATLATTIDTPWAHFRADLAAAKRDWWSGVKPDLPRRHPTGRQT